MKSFEDNSVCATSGHPVPLNSKTNTWGFGSHLLWDMHHYILLNWPTKLSGELCAIRRKYVENVPEAAGGDDIYLERIVLLKNGKISYEPRSIIYIMGPKSARDYFKQRRRVMGHQIKAELSSNIPSPTTDYVKIISVLMKNLKQCSAVSMVH